MECDSKEVVQELNAEAPSRDLHSLFLEDLIQQRRQFSEVEVVWGRQTANEVAHRIAKWAFARHEIFFWENEPPSMVG